LLKDLYKSKFQIVIYLLVRIHGYGNSEVKFVKKSIVDHKKRTIF